VKTYVLYHESCPDGAAAAWAAWRQFGSNAEYFPVNYGKPMPVMEDGAEIYVLDFSYPRQQLIDLAKRSTLVTVLDHHATAEKDLAGLEMELRSKMDNPHKIHFDMTKSGAVLAWEHFFPDVPVPEILAYIQDRDRKSVV